MPLINVPRVETPAFRPRLFTHYILDLIDDLRLAWAVVNDAEESR